jgi:hypothetical protein
MSEFIKSEVEKLNWSFVEKTGEPFAHFFCPILFRDEETELCKAHIINKAFSNSTRECTVQRADVDSFYGSRFEADFIGIEMYKGCSLLDIVADPSLSKRFNATVLHKGTPVEHFYSRAEIPEKFSRLDVPNLDASLAFGLKMQSSDLIAAAGDQQWEIEVSRDLSLSMLVSTIKAAHLSLFKMLGYRYALRQAGYFIGRTILGEFFLENCEKSKQDLSHRALQFFREFVHMVRPIISTTIEMQGTVTDGLAFLCMGGSGSPWAVIVLVKTEEQLYGVMVPTFESPDQIDAFLSFLKNTNSSIRVATGQLEEDKWTVSKDTAQMTWPKDGVLLP